MPPNPYAESEVDESFKAPPSNNTSRSTASRNSTNKTSISSRNPSTDRASKDPKSSTHAGKQRPKGSAAPSEPTSPSIGSKTSKNGSKNATMTARPQNTMPTMVGTAPRPPNAIDTIGGYYVPEQSPVSTSPNATFAPSSYHAPPAGPLARPRSGSSSRSRPTSVCYPTPDGVWIPDQTPSNTRPTQVHAHSTPQIPSQQHVPRAGVPSPTVASGTWVRDDPRAVGAYPGAAQPRIRPSLQQQMPGAQQDGRRASMYGAPVVQHHQASYCQPGYTAPNVYASPAQSTMGPPQALPIRTSSTQQPQALAAGFYGSSYGDGNFVLARGIDPNQTIRPPRTSSMQRPTIIPQQAKAKSTSYYTKTSGALATSAAGNPLATEHTSSRKRREKAEQNAQSARDYQDRMDSRASKTSQELTAEALEERRRSKKDRAVASEPTPKARSANISQSRHSRAGSSVSRTGTDMDQSIQITLDGNNVGISDENGNRSIEIRTGEDGRRQITVGSPTKRRDQSYHGGSSRSGLSFADRAKRRDGTLSAVDARDED